MGKSYFPNLFGTPQRKTQLFDNIKITTSMINKTILGIMLFYVLFSCFENTKSIKNTENTLIDSTSFKSPYDTLVKLELPFILSPIIWDDLLMEHFEKFNFEIPDYWKLLDHPYAKLVDAKNYKAIIFYANNENNSPSIVTIGKNGKPIDTLLLIRNSGGNDPSFYSTAFVKVNTDLSIQIIDSVSTFEIDQNGLRIESSLELKVINEKFKIFETGEIK